jgi:glutathione synthase
MIRLAILMDDIEKQYMDPFHDTTILMYLSAQKKNWKNYYFQLNDLYYDHGEIFIRAAEINIDRSKKPHYTLSDYKVFPATYFNIILQRKDPPFNMEYLYSTYLLQHAEERGVHVFNKPSSLRDANEKVFATWFKEFMSPTLISSDKAILKAFIQEQQHTVLKPLDGMGGASIFSVRKDDPNKTVIIENLTQNGTQHIMAQRYIPAIKETGDRRILVINGEPLDYSLARLPALDDFRGNMARDANVQVMPLTSHEKQVATAIGKTLREKGLLFVGLDMIGDYVTEINVTSPTCAQEIEQATGINAADLFLNVLEKKISETR